MAQFLRSLEVLVTVTVSHLSKFEKLLKHGIGKSAKTFIFALSVDSVFMRPQALVHKNVH